METPSGIIYLYVSRSVDFTADSVLLQQYLDKRLFVQLNGSRKVIGVLRGYDVRLHGYLVNGTS